MQSVISLALIVSVIGFYCTINTTLAWFSKSNEVSASYMSVSVKKSTDTVAYLHSYPVLDISDNKYTISYENESFTLPTNDPNEISFSIYKKALAVFHFAHGKKLYCLKQRRALFDTIISSGTDSSVPISLIGTPLVCASKRNLVIL